ncbi:DUF1934 domain-containing protein [Bacillus songklensis]|uniref:DUF1934 domain-containing protein n=1 Tax=Bacillus songklensis TaxID=1069116 RepID=A0ABV8BAN9_9BACI
MSIASSTGKSIHVKVVTDIRDGHRKETNSFQAQGMYYEKENAVYVTYKEQQDMGDINTIVKIAEGEVIVTRSGAVKMKQQFRKKERTSTPYKSQYGPLHMETFTHNFEYKRFQTKGTLFVTYDLYLQGEKAGKYALTISFKEQ